MALAKNSIVIPNAAIVAVGEAPFGYGGFGIPIVGSVESVGPAVVCWENGTKVTYQTEAQLSELAVVSLNVTALYHHRVKIIGGAADEPADPNGQGASEGLVIGVFTLKTGNVDFVVVQFSANDIAVFPAASVAVIDP